MERYRPKVSKLPTSGRRRIAWLPFSPVRIFGHLSVQRRLKKCRIFVGRVANALSLVLAEWPARRFGYKNPRYWGLIKKRPKPTMASRFNPIVPT